MKILITGANGYIGSRLIPLLLEAGHDIVALVRRFKTFPNSEKYSSKLTVIQGDLLDLDSLNLIPEVEVAYYLVHSMIAENKEFLTLEIESAINFVTVLQKMKIQQVVYLSGISHEKKLSPHLQARRAVEEILKVSKLPYTILRSAVIVGLGSASFEMIRDLCEKLPVMVTPRWVNNGTQPISIFDVLFYLKVILGVKETFNQIFEIGGPDLLTYKQMLEIYCEVRGLKRWIINVPFLTPRLSSYWLYFVTSTNFYLASALVESLKNETLRQNFKIDTLFPHNCLSYKESIKEALSKVKPLTL